MFNLFNNKKKQSSVEEAINEISSYEYDAMPHIYGYGTTTADQDTKVKDDDLSLIHISEPTRPY